LITWLDALVRARDRGQPLPEGQRPPAYPKDGSTRCRPPGCSRA